MGSIEFYLIIKGNYRENFVYLVADDRTKGWMMVDSPAPTIFYTVIYFIIVGLGPKYMKNRKPFKLTSILIPYNVLMTLLNLYIAVEVCQMT